jgi:hypothetical protein
MNWRSASDSLAVLVARLQPEGGVLKGVEELGELGAGLDDPAQLPSFW